MKLESLRETPVSIVITCYNLSHYLKDAINSALSQSHRFCTVFVIDDGSTDDTASIASEFPEVNYIYQVNQGLSAARNTGIASSKDRFILFLDADDVLSPRCCEVSLKCFERNPDSAAVYGAHRVVDKRLRVINKYKYTAIVENHYNELLKGNFIGMQSCVVYSRVALEKLGGFDTALKCCEDYDLYIRLSKEFSIATHNHVCADYRKLSGSMSSDTLKMLRTVLEILDRESPRVRSSEKLSGVISEGKKNWFNYYATQLVEDDSEIFKTSNFEHILRIFISVPGPTVATLFRQLTKKIRSRLRWDY